MKNRLVTFFLSLILISILIFLGNLVFNRTKAQVKTEPMTALPNNQNSKPTLIPTPTEIIYNFDKSTNLKTELETINPEVLNSDFDNLKKITTSL
ncbi:MAG: hypothetical protein WCV81_00995 [Microgenomates group bacterium]|jgi:hypothetical protein